MAVRLNPCFGCPLKDGCPDRDDWRRKVSGLGLASARFRCKRLADQVRLGRRIVITAPVFGEGDYGEYDMARQPVHATISSVYPDHRFSAIVDRGQIEDMVLPGTDPNQVRFRKRMRHSRIVQFLDEPDGTFCKLGSLKAGDECDQRDGQCGCKQEKEWAA